MRVRVRYQGRVQGVGFRATVRHLASGMPLSGWVRNEPDGSVLMEAQGDESGVHRLLSAVRGQMGRSIQSERAERVAEVAGEGSFDIRYE